MFEWITYLILFILTVLFCVITYYKWAFTYWDKWDIPTLSPTIPFGDLENLLTRKMSRMEELKNMHLDFKKRGYKHCGIYQLASPTYFVTDLDIIKDICIKDFEHFQNRNFYYNERDDPISAHLLTMEGQRWKEARSKTTTIFTANKLKWMFQNMVDVSNAMMDYLDKVVEERKFPMDARKLTSSFTADAAGSSILGIKCASFTDPDQNFLTYGHKALETDRAGQLRMLCGFLFPNFARFLRFPQVTKDVSSFFTKNISETILKRKQRNVQRKDFLQLLMNLQNSDDNAKPLTDSEVISLAFGLFIGAFETSSNTLAFCLFNLAKETQYQDKLREEVVEILKKYDDKITFDAINEMTYIGQVLDETLRMYPPVHTINRVCTKEYKVPGHNLVIEKDIKVMVTITGIHYDPEFYERPEEFYPDHFTDENRKSRPAFAFVPFGAGPRKCVGGRYGNLQLKVALAALVRRFKFTLNKKMQLPLQLSPTTIVPVAKDGIWLDIQKL